MKNNWSTRESNSYALYLELKQKTSKFQRRKIIFNFISTLLKMFHGERNVYEENDFVHFKRVTSIEVREVREMLSGLIFNEGEIPIYTFLGETVDNVADGRDRTNPGFRILPLLSANGNLQRRTSGYRSGQILVLRLGNYPEGR